MRTHRFVPFLQRLLLETQQTCIGMESTKKCFFPLFIFMAIFLRISSHKPVAFFLRSLNCFLDMRLWILYLYSCSLYSNSHFSLSMLSVSAVKDKAITSKSENLWIGLRWGILSCSLTIFL